jgi:hypothetical protein
MCRRILRRDTNSDLRFTLVVDDFGVRYTQNADAVKLVTTLKQLSFSRGTI